MERVKKYWQLYPWLMSVALCAVLISCQSQQSITKTETKTKTIERDSVYCYDKDSMAITLRHGAHTLEGQTLMSYPCRVDTIIIDRWHTHYKDRWLTRTDTLSHCDTVTITQTITKTQTQTKEVKHVPKFYKWCTGLFFLLAIAITGTAVYKIFIKKRWNIVAIIKKALSL